MHPRLQRRICSRHSDVQRSTDHSVPGWALIPRAQPAVFRWATFDGPLRHQNAALRQRGHPGRDSQRIWSAGPRRRSLVESICVFAQFASAGLAIPCQPMRFGLAVQPQPDLATRARLDT